MHYFTAFLFYLGVLGRCSCFKSPPRPFLPSIRSSTTPSRLQYKDEDDIGFHPTTFAGEELIPKGQLPIAEYRELLELPFFDWPTKEVRSCGEHWECANMAIISRAPPALFLRIQVAACY